MDLKEKLIMGKVDYFVRNKDYSKFSSDVLVSVTNSDIIKFDYNKNNVNVSFAFRFRKINGNLAFINYHREVLPEESRGKGYGYYVSSNCEIFFKELSDYLKKDVSLLFNVPKNKKNVNDFLKRQDYLFLTSYNQDMKNGGFRVRNIYEKLVISEKN